MGEQNRELQNKEEKGEDIQGRSREQENELSKKVVKCKRFHQTTETAQQGKVGKEKETGCEYTETWGSHCQLRR